MQQIKENIIGFRYLIHEMLRNTEAEMLRNDLQTDLGTYTTSHFVSFCPLDLFISLLIILV